MRLYDLQRDGIESVALNKETVIVAANKMGKDFMAGVVGVTFFEAPWLYFPEHHFKQLEVERARLGQVTGREVPPWQVHTRRIISTSVDGDQLRNLWGEVSRLVASSEVPLNANRGGPFVVNQREITLAEERTAAGADPLNYFIGRVTATGEGMAGAHAAYNLMIIDEASGSDNKVYEFAATWAKKMLVFGNANPTTNFFFQGIKGGNVLAEVRG